MTTIYVVTSGEYSDYSIECAFETEALAQEFCDIADAGATSNHSWVAMPVLDKLPPHRSILNLATRQDHTVGAKPDEWTHVVWDYEDTEKGCQSFVNDPKGFGWSVVTQGWDHERVRKAHAENVAKTRFIHEMEGTPS